MLARRSFLPLIPLGFILSLIAAALIWAFPDRRAGINPFTVLSMVLGFGGIGLMAFGASMEEIESRSEQAAFVRKLVRQALCIGPIYAALSQLHFWPFELMVSVILGVYLEVPVRRMLVWLGKA